MNKCIAQYRETSYFDKKEAKGVNLVDRRKKLSSLIYQKVNKKQIQLQPDKLNSKLTEVGKNKIENVTVVLSSKRKRNILIRKE